MKRGIFLLTLVVFALLQTGASAANIETAKKPKEGRSDDTGPEMIYGRHRFTSRAWIMSPT